ncbi:hypothetical protein [Streptomyces roseolus]|uniref:hypothetical protein n=1 Tax=Streptomyces roseolus TaxID=67358 RepID=UPI00378E2147
MTNPFSLAVGLGLAEAAGDVVADGDVRGVPGCLQRVGDGVVVEVVRGFVAGVRQVPA